MNVAISTENKSLQWKCEMEEPSVPTHFPQSKWRHSCFYHSTERHVSHVLFVNYKKDRINTKMKLKDTTKPFAEFSNLNTPLSFRYGRGRDCVLCIIVYCVFLTKPHSHFLLEWTSTSAFVSQPSCCYAPSSACPRRHHDVTKKTVQNHSMLVSHNAKQSNTVRTAWF